MGDLWDLADLRTPWSLYTVVTLRIAEHIEAGATDVHTLAATADCDATALHNVLSHLASRGVFEGPEPGRFRLNQAARGLLEPGIRLGFDLHGLGGRFVHAWSTLPTYLRTGRSGYHELFGRGFWEDLAAHPELAADFDELMGPAGHGTPSAEIDLVDGWDSVRTVVDVGGGTGALLTEILRARPGYAVSWSTCPARSPAPGRSSRRQGWPSEPPRSGRASSTRCPPAATSTC